MNNKVGQRLGDINSLPEDVKALLNKKIFIEESLVEEIRKLGGEASIDEIIVGMYRLHGVKFDNRKTLVNKLYRMERKKMICRHGQKRGVWIAPNYK